MGFQTSNNNLSRQLNFYVLLLGFVYIAQLHWLNEKFDELDELKFFTIFIFIFLSAVASNIFFKNFDIFGSRLNGYIYIFIQLHKHFTFTCVFSCNRISIIYISAQLTTYSIYQLIQFERPILFQG